MIDYEVKIFNRYHSHVAPYCAPKQVVSTVIKKAPPAFPASSLIEIDNYTYRKGQSSELTENFSVIVYQLEVFATTKKECREVFSVADTAMISMNFSRISGQYIDNADNVKVFRYVARYEAMIDKNGTLYRIG